MKDYCCVAMEKAIKEDYLFKPLLMVEETIKGKKRINLVAKQPALYGPRLTPHGKKTKPSFFLNMCPWCGHDYTGENGGGQ